MIRRLFPLIILTALLACAPRGFITLDPAAEGVGVVEPIFVATSRIKAPAPELFGNGRSETVSFARYDISIPPHRETGSVDFPGRAKPNPEKHFLTVQETAFGDGGAFRKSLNAQLAVAGEDKRVIVFVHGFNTNLAEGVYRVAQMAHDLELPGTIVHFAWPSAGSPFGYVHDRDSATFSRDGLEDMMDEISKSNAKSVVLMAHSMGSFLAMESLRQMSTRGGSRAYHKIEAVILISPDIDVDVFRNQMLGVEDVPQPFVIFGNPRDRALKLSSFLTAEPARVGNLKDPSVLGDLPITYVDIGAFNDGSSHFAVATSPELIGILDKFRAADGWLQADSRRTANPLSGILMAAGDVTKVVLTPVAGITSAIVGNEGNSTTTYQVPVN